MRISTSTRPDTSVSPRIRLRHLGNSIRLGNGRRLGPHDLHDPVHRVHPELGGSRLLDRLVMHPDPIDHIGRMLPRQFEQHRAVLVVDPSGPHPLVHRALDRLDVQPGSGVILGELLQEGVRLLFHRPINLMRLLGHDQH
ncbi:hypothetical protein [Acidipropionibacterium jensenii]|uniref:hypothetical protein n=1 Tax=Acidipropionibacterium jensenii TaxID=1749 RepID=UPI001FDFA85A|nr:hypothetical protein [Acidipropionibacterium jensenii]